MQRNHLISSVLLLTATAPAYSQTLVARYQLDEASGTMCVDSSGNGLDGTYRGNFTLGEPGAGGTCDTAVDFDAAGMTDVIIPGAPPLQTLTQSLSVSAWINPETIPAQFEARRIFGNNDGGWMCGLNGDGLIFTTRFIQDYLQPGAGLVAGDWAHVAFVFDSNFGVTFYVDGFSLGFVAGSSPANAPNPDWFIGGFNGSIEFWDGLLDDVQVYDGELTAAQVMTLATSPCTSIGAGTGLGTNYCMAATNSTGSPGLISASGSTVAAANDLTLTATQLPNSQFGIFVTSMTQAFVPAAGGTSNGNLCVGGNIGRFSLPNQILSTGSTGSISLTVDTTQVPQGASFTTISAGDTWNFQAWHRDTVGLGSNFTEGLEIEFF